MAIRFRAAWNSLFTQVLTVSLAALFGLFAFMLFLFQTTAMFRLMPFALANVAEPVSEIVFLIESVPTEAEPLVLAVFGGPNRNARLRDGFPHDAERRPLFRERISSRSSEVAGILAGREMRFRHIGPFKLIRQVRREEVVGVQAAAALEISIALEDGRVLCMMFAPASVFIGEPRGLFAVLFIAAVSIGAIAALLLGQAVKPLRELESTAQRFGSTIDPEPAREAGAEEVRRVARALNRMQERVSDLMAERARIVAGVAHDIRTSLTRMRLRLDQPKNLDPEALARDLDQMQAMVEDMLTFARSDQPTAQQELIDLGGFVRTYVEDAPDNFLDPPAGCDSGFSIAADRKALTRALNNLVDNARRYGGAVRLNCSVTNRAFEIHIDDDGAGIPEDQLESVFEPFFRLEGSRNRETGGSGLGLGIARALIRAQGGEVRLENRLGGGLRATIGFAGSRRID